MDANTDFRVFISCAPGFEPSLIQELDSLGIRVAVARENKLTLPPVQTGEDKGGVEFSATLEQIMACNLKLRTASRVIVRLGEFYTVAFSELRKKASRLNWELFLKPGQPVEVKVTCHKSKLYHSDAVAERVVGAIEDHLKQPVKIAPEAKNKQLILVRLVEDHCTVSVDSSGELLHRRGYRQAVAKAPLRENLAAGLILAAGWRGTTPLIDPFCGSGTIPIEAVLLARHIAPGINRSFAFSNWPIFQPDLFLNLVDQAHRDIQPASVKVYGSDRDQGAIEMASANAARTGVLKDIQFACHAISDLPAFTGPGLILTNPPYGMRIHSGKDLRNLYASFGKLLQQNYSGWQVGILCSEPQLIHALELGPYDSVLPLVNGGIPVKFYRFSIH